MHLRFLLLGFIAVAQPVGLYLNWPALQYFGAMSWASPAPNPLSKLGFDYFATTEEAKATLKYRDGATQTLSGHQWKREVSGPHRVRVVYLMADYHFASDGDPIGRAALESLFCTNEDFRRRLAIRSDLREVSFDFGEVYSQFATSVSCR